MEDFFYTSPTSGIMSLPEMIFAIASYVEEDESCFYRLLIGTDSLIKSVSNKKQCDFVTAIVVHRVGKGAIYFWKKEKIYRAPSLREKIYTETYTSLRTANLLVPKLRERLSYAHYELEIHIDVGEVGPTREMIRELVGMVTGNGFTAKTKPESWAASSVADRHT